VERDLALPATAPICRMAGYPEVRSSEIMAFVAMQPVSANVYDALVHAEYDSSGGQTIYLSYSRSTPATFSSEMRLVAVEFEPFNAQP
jgi:hypothetical protein